MRQFMAITKARARRLADRAAGPPVGAGVPGPRPAAPTRPGPAPRDPQARPPGTLREAVPSGKELWSAQPSLTRQAAITAGAGRLPHPASSAPFSHVPGTRAAARVSAGLGFPGGRQTVARGYPLHGAVREVKIAEVFRLASRRGWEIHAERCTPNRSSRATPGGQR
jgi:hypothetical protein